MIAGGTVSFCLLVIYFMVARFMSPVVSVAVNFEWLAEEDDVALGCLITIYRTRR